MTSLKQKFLAGAAAAVVAVGGGIAIANVGTGETASAGQTPGQMGGPGGGGMGGGPGGGQQDLSGLAEDLGVSEAKLQEAFRSAMPQPGSGTPGQGGGPEAMAANLAEALGLDEAEVQEALEANRPDGAPSGSGQSPSTPPTGQAAPSTSGAAGSSATS